jgi:hypothetical protein
VASKSVRPSTSYRFDPETLALIDQLRERLRDPDTGQPRSSTDVLRQAVRLLAKETIPGQKRR